jgi:hypothetical protein
MITRGRRKRTTPKPDSPPWPRLVSLQEARASSGAFRAFARSGRARERSPSRRFRAAAVVLRCPATPEVKCTLTVIPALLEAAIAESQEPLTAARK